MKMNLKPALVYMLIIMIGCALTFFTSCTSKSGHYVAIPIEKVVVIDMTPHPEISAAGEPIYSYKVKRIELGVMDYMSTDYLFEAGDTIRYKFIR